MAFPPSAILQPPFCLRFPTAQSRHLRAGTGWYDDCVVRRGRRGFRNGAGARTCASGKPKQGTVRVQNPPLPDRGQLRPGGLVQHQSDRHQFASTPAAWRRLLRSRLGHLRFRCHELRNPATFKDHQGIGNLDYVINSKNTFSGRYIYETDPLDAPFGAQIPWNRGIVCRALLLANTKQTKTSVAKLTIDSVQQRGQRIPRRVPAGFLAQQPEAPCSPTRRWASRTLFRRSLLELLATL